MYSDEFKHQLPDVDPGETADWIESFDELVGVGAEREEARDDAFGAVLEVEVADVVAVAHRLDECDARDGGFPDAGFAGDAVGGGGVEQVGFEVVES